PCGAGDLAVGRTAQEAPRLAGAWVAREHLVVAEGRELTLVEPRGRGVGLDPQHPARIEREPVRTAEDVALDVPAILRFFAGGVAAQHQVVPAESRRVEVAILLPADDLAHLVEIARIGAIGAR